MEYVFVPHGICVYPPMEYVFVLWNMHLSPYGICVCLPMEYAFVTLWNMTLFVPLWNVLFAKEVLIIVWNSYTGLCW